MNLICRLIGHNMKPYKAYTGSSFTIEKCVRCHEKGKVLESQADNRESQRTTPWIPNTKKN